MIAIGFANVMFTLWNVFDEGTHTVYKYVKNISSDLNEVERLYPGVPVNYSLKGHYMVFPSSDNKEVIEADRFQFGQYKGEPFSNVGSDYLFWYYNQIGNQESREILESILTKTGKYHMYDGRLVDQKEYDWRTQDDKEFESALELVKSGNSIDILVTSNARYTENDRVVEYIMDTENPKIYLVFNEENVKEMSYNGYYYYLPIVDGKAKRWKNKVVSIPTTNYEVKYNSIYIKF